ncbi:hypothetical protein OKW96_12080 [Sphingobacterium sp. KU25419]|nr:hypothetical protein OKW96_12080 [Sphingobacterium sp. KU25419]
MPWYSFTPGGGFPDLFNPNNYTPVGSTPPSCPNLKRNLCAIQASDNTGSPIFTSSLMQEIGNAVLSKTESRNVLLRP